MPRTHPDVLAACTRIASRQFGVVSRGQALRAGMSADALARLGSGPWRRVHPGVFALWRPADARSRWYHHLFAGQLWLGERSGVSHRAAARIWALDGVRAAPPEFVTTGRRGAGPDLIVHRVRSLPEPDLVRRHGLIVTTPSRTLLDLAALGDERRTELAFESILRLGLATREHLEHAVETSGPTRAGRGFLRELLTQDRAEATESVLEARLWRVIRRARLPMPVRQFEVRDAGGRFIARVDLAYPDLQVAIEADGYAYHSGKRRWARDRARLNALANAGWMVYRVTWEDVTKRPRALAGDLGRLLEAARRYARARWPTNGTRRSPTSCARWKSATSGSSGCGSPTCSAS